MPTQGMGVSLPVRACGWLTSACTHLGPWAQLARQAQPWSPREGRVLLLPSPAWTVRLRWRQSKSVPSSKMKRTCVTEGAGDLCRGAVSGWVVLGAPESTRPRPACSELVRSSETPVPDRGGRGSLVSAKQGHRDGGMLLGGGADVDAAALWNPGGRCVVGAGGAQSPRTSPRRQARTQLLGAGSPAWPPE